MKIVLAPNSPLTIREQIKRQIKALIEEGQLPPGCELPSARDMSSMLKVNRNTVTQAYKELAADEVLKVVLGSGTFVKKHAPQPPKREINRIFDEAIKKAKMLGLSLEDISERFINRLATLSIDFSEMKVLIVDCNREVVDYLCDLLREKLGVQTEGVLIQSIEQTPIKSSERFRDKDLIVCGFNHLEELKRAVPGIGVEIAGVMLKPDAKVLKALSRIPEGTRVGYVCANQRSTETLYNSSFFSGGRELIRILAGLDSHKRLQKLVKECKVIFATGFVYDRVKPLIKPSQTLNRVDISIDSSSLDLIKERLLQCHRPT
jgi:DNA-binding transcriptional regulator YhcF (GntR family)